MNTPTRTRPLFKSLPARPCEAVGCQHLVQPGFLMCSDHWRKVPKKLQAEVWRTWRALNHRNAGPEDAVRYRKAKQAAIDAVHQKQLTAKHKADAATRPLF